MKTVKVRVAVAVDPSGKWSAAGWSREGTPDEGAAMDLVLESVDEGEARYWIEAELPLPGTVTFKGEVLKTQMENYPKSVQNSINYLNKYKENNHVDEFNILHIYPVKLAYTNGYHDNMIFDLHCFNTSTMQKRILTKKHGIRFIDHENIKSIKVFADGSTMIIFERLVKLFISQNVWIEKSTEENK